MGTIYVYDRSSGQTKATNDLLRNESVRTEVLASMNMLGKTSPLLRDDRDVDPERRRHSRTATSGSRTCCRPASRTARPGWASRLTVRATYHQDLIVPLISAVPAEGRERPDDAHRRSHDGHQLMAASRRAGPACAGHVGTRARARFSSSSPLGITVLFAAAGHGVRRRPVLQRAALPPERGRRRRAGRGQRPHPGRERAHRPMPAPARSSPRTSPIHLRARRRPSRRRARCTRWATPATRTTWPTGSSSTAARSGSP